MEYVILAGIAILSLAGLARLIDMIAVPIGEKLARREWNKTVIRQMKLRQRESWEEQLINTAKSFSVDEIQEESRMIRKEVY